MTTEAAVRRRNNVRVLGRPDAPVIVFAHGFGCDQGMWNRLLPHVVDDYRVVLLDHVGSGGSDADAYDSERYSTLDGYAADLLEICTVMDLTDVTVVAHSVGAMMALTAAVREPGRLARLVLVAPSPYYLDDPADGYDGGFSRADVDGLLRSLETNYFAWAASLAPMVMGNPGSPELAGELTESFCRTDPDVARDFARVTFLSDCRHLLPEVTTPTLLLQCADDLLAPPTVGRYLRSRIPGSELVELAATGHCPHVSAPLETATVIRAYLGRPR
ncbi:alpha/beta fold hydrolase [Solicola sp. PLA-1-18]|uniref:alpha/beta fold hydrolase n=1 Tax=Solicola sp. PLA-1-18 TaxID=3380532 RepID=UPI003B7C2ED1